LALLGVLNEGAAAFSGRWIHYAANWEVK